MANNTHEAAVTLYRVAHPRARRPGLVGIIRNGSRKRVYECGVCGARISMDAKWPMPRCVARFISNHETSCSRALCLAHGVAVEG